MIYISDNTVYKLRGSLIYSMPIPYRKVMNDDRSWDKLWVEHFGKNGAVRYEFKDLEVAPYPQPRVTDYLDMGDLVFDLDKTITYNRNIVRKSINKIFSKWPIIQKQQK